MARRLWLFAARPPRRTAAMLLETSFAVLVGRCWGQSNAGSSTSTFRFQCFRTIPYSIPTAQRAVGSIEMSGTDSCTTQPLGVTPLARFLLQRVLPALERLA